MTYEVIPLTQHNPAEYEFLKVAQTIAKGLVADHTVANAMASYKYYPLLSGVSRAMEGVALDGLRPAWLNTVGELYSNPIEYVSQYQDLLDKATATVYYYALGTIEAQSFGN
jgi:hypothetical protein